MTSGAIPPQTSSNRQVDRAYKRWAPVYDLVFAAIMRPGREAIAAACADRPLLVLDAGAGTGLEFPLFSKQTRLIGIDLCEAMLRRAQKKVKAEKLGNVEGLLVMDAARLAYADHTFDLVIAPYVLTVLPEVHASLDEFLRVLKPGGEVILVNHFGASKGVLKKIEAFLGRHAKALGWQPEFAWRILQDWIDTRPCKLVEKRLLPPIKLFTFVRIIKS